MTRCDGLIELLSDDSATTSELRIAVELWRELVEKVKPTGSETMPLSAAELRKVRAVLALLDRGLTRASRRCPRHLELVHRWEPTL